MQCARSAISRRFAVAVAVGFAFLSLASGALWGCGVVRPSDFGPVCPSYEAAIRPLIETRCTACHSATKAEGGYQVGAHTDTVSRRDDGTPRIAPGEVSSLFLTAVRGELGRHTALEAKEVSALESWVVACRAAPLPHQFHPKGWATPTDPEQFHGVALRENFYHFTSCQECHGEDLRGGASKVDCQSCHQQGPLACNTCHGDKDSAAPPRDLKGVRSPTSLGVGAHRAHVTDGPVHKAYSCASCHQDVKNATDEGHYRSAGVFSAGPAQVRLASGPGGEAKWDRATATCTNVYCHAPSKTDMAPSRKNPVWTRAGKGDIDCGSCHGAPPSSHADNRCELCHGNGYADGGVDLGLHLDGQVQLRNGGQRCDSCHAGPQSFSFVDLRGNIDAGVQTVGAHNAHLHANRLRGPLSCDECHLVPAGLTAPGHIDSPAPAEVFPFDLGTLAWKFGASPTWNSASGTCGTVYCHGGGNFGHPDNAPGLLRTPSWTGKADQAACGTCHGLPPQDGTIGHNAATSIACQVCHGGTVSADGGIIFSTLADGGLTSKHMDGRITGQ